MATTTAAAADDKRVWTAIELTVKAEAEDAAHYALSEAGATGTETNALRKEIKIGEPFAPLAEVPVIGYFEVEPEDASLKQTLATAWRIHNLTDDVLIKCERREIIERDWLAEWKAGWQPVVIDRFVIAPPWSETSDLEQNRFVIRIEPGMAFGTGTHETTQLCLRLIARYGEHETYFRQSFSSFLDVGCGTGILAMATAMLNPHARIEACDTDAKSVDIARENAKLNKVDKRIDFHSGSVTEATASADVVCANLTADVILPLLPLLLQLTCGELILSGILATQVDGIRTRLAELGAREKEILSSGEWVAFLI